MIVLDSSALIEIVKGSHEGEVLKEKIGKESLGITSLSVNEVLVSSKGKEKKVLEEFIEDLEILDFDEESAFKSVEIESHLKSGGNLVGKLDILIASICLSKNFALATLDKDFRKIKKLSVVGV